MHATDEAEGRQGFRKQRIPDSTTTTVFTYVFPSKRVIANAAEDVAHGVTAGHEDTILRWAKRHIHSVLSGTGQPQRQPKTHTD